MKTTVDLPSDLVREIKLQAIHDGRKLKDAVTDLLRAGLAAHAARSQIGKSHKKVLLPTVKCRHVATPSAEITPPRVAEILLKQEVSWNGDARR